jgi:hypothetical protein
MRSDRTTFWTLLRSQGLGVCCGLSTTLLLAIGSFVIAATRGGASAGLRLDEVLPFFEPPAVAHLWFYLLLPVLGLYGLNTALATWHSVSIKWRNGLRQPWAYGAAFIHVGFLLALLAHLVGGIGGSEQGLLLHGAWSELPDGRQARVTSIDLEQLPGGMPKAIRVAIEIQSESGLVETGVLGYNQPLSSGLGANLVLLQRPVPVPVSAVLTAGGEQCTLSRGGRCRLGGYDVHLVDLRDSGAHGMLARVITADRDGWIALGTPQPFAQGYVVTLDHVERQTGAVVTWRRAPGNPWALGAALFLIVGVGLMWRRFV